MKDMTDKTVATAISDLQEWWCSGSEDHDAFCLLIAKTVEAARQESRDLIARYKDDSERLTHVLMHGMPATAGGKYWYRDGKLFTTAIDCIDAAIAIREEQL